jgi:uncharacterized protein
LVSELIQGKSNVEIYTIPISGEKGNGKYIIYRPLIGQAFIGNHAMANLALSVANRDPTNPLLPEPDQALKFLYTLGFDQPDPPLPEPPGLRYQPTAAVLLLTNQCHLRCTYCYAAAGEAPRDDLSIELGRSAIDFVCQTAIETGKSRFRVSFHGGGEPTYAWKTLKALSMYARQQRLPAQISLTSNGIWSTQICQWIIENMDNISLSMDGTPETQDRQRPIVSGLGSSTLVMRSIEALDRSNAKYGIRMTATSPWNNLPKDVQFICDDTNCQAMQVEPAFNTQRGGHGVGGEDEYHGFANAYLQSREIASRAGRKLHYSGVRTDKITSSFCTAPFNALIVNASGLLVTCYQISSHIHPLAGISTIGCIEDGKVIIDQAARENLHNLIAERRSSCRDCFCYWSCAGDCYTRTFQDESGGHLVYGDRCIINRYTTERVILDHIAKAEGVWYRQQSDITPAEVI